VKASRKVGFFHVQLFGREVYPERNKVETKEAQEEEQKEKCCFERNGTFLFPSILTLTDQVKKLGTRYKFSFAAS